MEASPGGLGENVTTPADLPDLARRAAPGMAVVAVWLLSHPYYGILHDAQLYVALALHSLRPEVFGHDFFLAGASQDDFTVFTAPFAILIELVGAGTASILVVALAYALWLPAAWMLCAELAKDSRATFVAMLFVAAMPAAYGGFEVFRFGEGFATPRVLAEALALWSLWSLVRRRWVAWALFAVAASALHPLMGMPALAVAVVFLALEDVRWLGAAGGGVALAVGMALSGIEPFDRLLTRIDAEWLSVLAGRNAYLFPALWEVSDWASVIVAVTIVGANILLASGRGRQLMLAVLLTGTGGLVVSLAGGDLLNDLLVVQLQPYRAMWLVHLMSAAGSGLLIARLFAAGRDGPCFLGLFVVAHLLLESQPVYAGGGLVVLVALIYARLRGRMPEIPGPVRGVTYALLIVFGGLTYYYNLLPRLRGPDTATSDAGGLAGVLASPTLLDFLAFGALVLIFAHLRRDAARAAFPVFAGLTLIASLTLFDRHEARGYRSAGAAPEVEVFRQHIGSDAQVYWERDARGAWFLLGRSSYVSNMQGAALVFSRDFAMTFRDRAMAIGAVENAGFFDVFELPEGSPRFPEAKPIARADLETVCRTAHELDFMVLSRSVEGAYVAEWRPGVPLRDRQAKRLGIVSKPIEVFYLYDCRMFRAEEPGPAPLPTPAPSLDAARGQFPPRYQRGRP